MKIEVTFRGRLTVTPEYDGEVFDHDEEVERAFDGTINELVVLGVEDPSVAGSLTSGEVEIMLTVEAESVVHAFPLADSAVRSALQAAGVHTPGRKIGD